MSCFWGIWPPPSPLPLSAAGLDPKLQSVVVDDGIHKSGKKDLKSVCRLVGFGFLCRWWQEELRCMGAVQEDEGMEQLLIAGFVHGPAVSGCGQCDWPSANRLMAWG